MKIGIIGCGLIGHKRAANIAQEDRVIVACDLKEELAQKLARQYDAASTTRWEDVLSNPEVDTVVIAVIHSELAKITHAAIQAGKHVLVEKPAARNADELQPVVEYYNSLPEEQRPVVKVGFNHRFHPAMQRAKDIIEGGSIGPLMFIRGRYGHGGRLGYDKEWRAQPEISGGGELLDQGMHLIDLSRWYLGDFSKVSGSTKTYFWDMPVDDNAFMLLETPEEQTAQLHVTWTEWKNLFSLEIYGKIGKLHIDGLGGSYGTERLAYYRMLPEMGPPETTIFEYPGPDVSWDAEWKNFKCAIDGTAALVGDLEDGYRALQVVKTLYQQNAS